VAIPVLSCTDSNAGSSVSAITWFPSGAGANSAFTAASNVRIGGTTIAAPINLGTTGQQCVRWFANATVAARAIYSVVVPGQFDGNSDDFGFVCNFEQLGTVASPQMGLYLWRTRPGVILPTIADGTSPSQTTDQVRQAAASTIPVHVGSRLRTLIDLGVPDGASTRMYSYYFNFARSVMGRTTDQSVLPGDHLTLCIAPTATLGSATFVDLYGISLRYRRNVSLNNRNARQIAASVII